MNIKKQFKEGYGNVELMLKNVIAVGHVMGAIYISNYYDNIHYKLNCKII